MTQAPPPQDPSNQSNQPAEPVAPAPTPGAPAPTPGLQEASSKKVLCGILGILLGSLGIHKFLLGYNKAGIIMLLVSLLTCGVGASVMGLIGLIEGIMYLMKSDEEFYNTYMVGTKEWF